LLLLVVLTHVLAPLAPLLLLLIVLTRVLVPPAPLLLLLVVLTHILARIDLCVHCVVTMCRMIAPNSSLQDWHACALDKEPWFDSLMVYNQKEDSFNHAIPPTLCGLFLSFILLLLHHHLLHHLHHPLLHHLLHHLLQLFVVYCCVLSVLITNKENDDVVCGAIRGVVHPGCTGRRKGPTERE
jgi:hypothetical protein